MLILTGIFLGGWLLGLECPVSRNGVWEPGSHDLLSFSLARVTSPHLSHSEGVHYPPREVRPQVVCSHPEDAKQLSNVHRGQRQGHDHDFQSFNSSPLASLNFLQRENSLLMCCCHWAELRADQLWGLWCPGCRTCLEEEETLDCLI